MHKRVTRKGLGTWESVTIVQEEMISSHPFWVEETSKKKRIESIKYINLKGEYMSLASSQLQPDLLKKNGDWGKV